MRRRSRTACGPLLEHTTRGEREEIRDLQVLLGYSPGEKGEESVLDYPLLGLLGLAVGFGCSHSLHYLPLQLPELK